MHISDSLSSLGRSATPPGARPDPGPDGAPPKLPVLAAGAAWTAAPRRPTTRPRGGRLLLRHQVPPVLAFNPHVRSGYRWHASPRAALACAVCCFNNETFNVVSHGLSLLWLAYYVASGRAAAAWPGGAGWRLALHLTPIALCLAASTFYHALLADAARYHLYLALDVAGVFLLAAAGGAGLATRGLPCAPPSYRAAATAAVATLAVLALRRASLARTPAARALPLAALLGGRLALLAWRAAAGTAPPAAVRRYLAAELLSAAGAAVNAARLPEAWWARRRRAGTPLLTDLIGNSHNIFHAAVLAALAAYHGAASADERAAVAARAACVFD